MLVHDLPAVKIRGTAPTWNWKVEAKGGRGKQQTSKSPVSKILSHYHFWPSYSGMYNFSIPIELSGSYEVNADQVGAGGRQAVVEIKVITTIKNRGKTWGHTKSIFKKKVTKGNSSGPFNYTYNYSIDADVWVGTKPEQTRNREVIFTTRVELYAFAKWHKSRASLNFVKARSAGIRFGNGTVMLRWAKPRKGEQAPPTK